VSVAIQADEPKFQAYKSGVLMAADCHSSLDHGVLAIGYGIYTDGTPYYIVKNSWGATWGDAGYLKVEMNVNGGESACGIELQPVYPETVHA